MVSSQARGQLTAGSHLKFPGHNRGGRDKVLLRGLEGDEDGVGEAGVEGVDGAGKGVEVDWLHGEVDAGHKPCQLTWRRLPALAQHGELMVVCNITKHNRDESSITSSQAQTDTEAVSSCLPLTSLLS